jgi:hypothetical protein
MSRVLLIVAFILAVPTWIILGNLIPIDKIGAVSIIGENVANVTSDLPQGRAKQTQSNILGNFRLSIAILKIAAFLTLVATWYGFLFGVNTSISQKYF